ncbi:peptidase S8/S53 domain-containing protein [Trametes punicea]|nr:peptidase S8/S53 domain-containing protein [Trametes punicea]
MLWYTASAIVASLFVVGHGKPTTRAMHVLETRESPPPGFVRVGPASPNATLNLRVALVQNDIAGLQKALYDVSTPASPLYGQYLSKEEVEKFVAPKPQSVDAVKWWLADNGIEATAVTPAGDWLAFSLTVEKATELLDADFSIFKHQETGETSIRTLSYSIPAELTAHIELVHPTLTFSVPRRSGPVFQAVELLKPGSSKIKRATGVGSATIPPACASPTPIRPACLQELYGIPTALAKSQSNHLGVIGYNGNVANLNDLHTFLTDFRPDLNPSTTFTVDSVDGGSNPQNASDISSEADFDTQYTVGLASGVPVHFISVGVESGHDAWLDTASYLLSQSAPPTCNICNMYMQLGARGTSMLFSSGDAGVGTGSCTTFVPTFPNNCPYVTSVGATTDFAPETAATLTTGGFSNYFAPQPWQTQAIRSYLSKLGSEYSGKYNASGRGFPDVSAQGVKVEYIMNGTEWLFTGTSVSSPIFASVIALLNDELVTAGKPPLGFLNPWLYQNASSALNDITSGSNPGCGTNGFPAEPGWDPVTGLGTPNYAKLRTAAGL